MSRPVGAKATVDSLKNWILDPQGDYEEAGYKGFKVIDHVESGAHIHHTEHHIFKVPKRYALFNLHPLVEKVVEKSGVQDGFVFVSAMHITAGVFVNDAEIGLLHDIARIFTDMAPYSKDNYQHHNTGEDNGDAHIKSILTNHFVQVPITKSKLDIGPYQQVFYAEYDGLRDKRIIIKVTGLRAASAQAPQPSAARQQSQATGK